MESSKSDGNKEQKEKETKILVDNQVVAIVDTSVEREIQNVLITTEFEQNQPSCSRKLDGETPPRIERKPPEVILAKADSTSSISISIDVHNLPHQENSAIIKEDKIHSDVPTRQEVTHHGTEITFSSSLINLFDDIEAFENLATNQPHVQSPPTTNPRSQSPVTNQPRGRIPKPPVTNQQIPSVHARNVEASPTTSRGIHILNIPNDSINRSLQRTDALVNVPNSSNRVLQRPPDQVLGPPPSYSKSLLDRRVNTCASIQFVAPIPPPSYDGMENELRYAHTLGHTGGFTLGLGNTWQGQPQPAYCPVCETVIITQVDIRVSRIAHIVAMVMFVLLCWPFCLLPYFLNVCNYTFHYCSVCHSYLGARRPFQRG